MNITSPLWVVFALVVAGFAAASVQGWFAGQYEVTRHGFRVGVSRRWYGPRAWVIQRARKDDDEPERFRVLQVDSKGLEVPWLKTVSIDNEDAGPSWAPVTDFYPEAVRRLRPWIFRHRWLRIPVPFDYRIVRRPAGYLEGVRDAA